MFENLECNESLKINGGSVKSDVVAYIAGKAFEATIGFVAATPHPARTTTRGGVKHNVPAYSGNSTD